MPWGNLVDDLIGIETLVLGESFNIFILPLELSSEEFSVKTSGKVILPGILHLVERGLQRAPCASSE